MELSSLIPSFETFLRAENRTVRTAETYREALQRLIAFLEGEGRPTDVDQITRADIISFRQYLVENYRPATASNRHRSLQQFYRWAVAEGIVKDDPMRGLKVPHVPEEPPPILTQEELRRLVRACEGKNFIDRRDMAIVRLLAATGMRLGELTDMTTESLDREAGVVTVIGKGRRPRLVPVDPRTAQALDRYARARAGHRNHDRADLWLGKGGRMRENGVYQAVKRRAKMAGLDIHPHQLRHTFAHRWKMAGGSGEDLMRVAGWRSPQMLARYGASAADERAILAARRLGLGEL